jgi:hypothetical protein
MLNDTTYRKSRCICKVQNVPIRYIKNIFKFFLERKSFKMEIKNPSAPFIFQKGSIRRGLFYYLFLYKVKFYKKGVDKMSSLLPSCLTEDVGRAEEEDLGEIHRHVQVVVHERGILLRICHRNRVQSQVHDGVCPPI